jgi:hypothetical protein
MELRPLISKFDFALLEVRNLCMAFRLRVVLYSQFFGVFDNISVLMKYSRLFLLKCVRYLLLVQNKSNSINPSNNNTVV